MRIAVCLLAKDEAPYLLEWIAYYLVIGFDQIVVYDNGSSDGTSAILEELAGQDPRVEPVWWPDLPGCAPQRSAYQDALERSQADWLGFFDIDEFLVLKGSDSITGLLESFGPEVSAVSVNWRHFGSSGHASRPEGLVLESYTRCPQRDFHRNAFVKSLVRPDLVRAMSAHVPYLAHGEHRRVDGRLFDRPNQAEATPILHDPAQLNHYVLRSREEYERKVQRGMASRAPDDPTRWDKFGDEFWQRYDINTEVDDTVLGLLPDVRRVMRDFQLGSSTPFRMGLDTPEPPRDVAQESGGPTASGGAAHTSEVVARILRGAHRYEVVRLQRRIETLEAVRDRLRSENRDLRDQLVPHDAPERRQ